MVYNQCTILISLHCMIKRDSTWIQSGRHWRVKTFLKPSDSNNVIFYIEIAKVRLAQLRILHCFSLIDSHLTLYKIWIGPCCVSLMLVNPTPPVLHGNSSRQRFDLNCSQTTCFLFTSNCKKKQKTQRQTKQNTTALCQNITGCGACTAYLKSLGSVSLLSNGL